MFEEAGKVHNINSELFKSIARVEFCLNSNAVNINRYGSTFPCIAMSFYALPDDIGPGHNIFPITSGSEFTHIYSVLFMLSGVFGNYHDYLPKGFLFDHGVKQYPSNIYAKIKIEKFLIN